MPRQPSNDRTIPFSDEAERSVLGAILVDDAFLLDCDFLTIRDFYRAENREVWQAMLRLKADERPIDPLILAEALAANPTLEKVGAAAYLSRLMDGIPKLVNARHYAEIVFELSKRRQLIHWSHDLSSAAFDGSPTVDFVRAIQDTQERTAATNADVSRSFGVEADSFLSDVSARCEGADRAALSWSTGISVLDETFGGLMPGFLYVVGARPRMGKSSLMTSIASFQATTVPTMIFSIEMPKRVVMARLFAAEAQVPLAALIHASPRSQIVPSEWAKLDSAFERFKNTDIVIDDRSTTLDAILATYRHEQRRRERESLKRIGVVWLDYMQILRGFADRRSTRAEQLSDALLQLRDEAKRDRFALVVLAQLKRIGEYSKKSGLPRRPSLEDLKETGGLEEHADTVMLIDRDEVHLADQDKPVGPEQAGTAWCRIPKNRHGAPRTVSLKFWRDFALFTEPEPKAQEAF